MDLLAESTKYLVTQGILGFTTLTLGFAVVYLYRDNRAIRAQNDKNISDERSKAATEMAEVRKALHEVQEARINEIRTAMAAVQKALDSVDQMRAFIQGRSAV